MTDKTHIKKAHQSVGNTIMYALALTGERAWATAADIMRRRLTASERAALAWATMQSLSKDQALCVVEGLDHFQGAGHPDVCLSDPASDAGWWASAASNEEIEAYAVAAVNRMAPTRRREFIEYLKEKQGAA